MKTNNIPIKYYKYSIVLLVVIVAVLVYVVVVKKNDNNTPVYSFLNPAVSFVDKKDLILSFQPLRESLQKKYEETLYKGFIVSIYFEYLPTGENITVNKDEKIWPASLIKIPVAMATMKKVQDKEWTLSNELVLLDSDKDSEFGTLYKKPTGTTFSIEQLLYESLANSDNSAHFILLRNLENEELESVYTHLGLEDIISDFKNQKSNDNRMTTKRYSVFFRSLYNASFLSAEYAQLFLDILEDAPDDYLYSGIPSNVRFVHKTGIRNDDLVYADSGIVYAGSRPYILTVMMQQKDGNTPGVAEEIFKSISEEVYTYVTTSKQN